jgi:CHAT domain-containing protein
LPDTNNFYLAESEPLIHRLGDERDLISWEGLPPGDGLLAMGGPDFDRAEPPIADSAGVAAAPRSSIPDTLRVRFTSLPGTGAEAAEVSDLWRRGGRGAPLELSGPAASEAAFKSRVAGRRVLHVATRGFTLGARARSGARGAAAGGAPAARRAPPMAGLALAGANVPADPAGEDGYLTTREIAALDLSRMEWAVLSARGSRPGDPDAVESAQGLLRSFRTAGARTVIVGLWAVDDTTSLAWMTRLYRARVAQKKSTALAARDACRSLIAERRAQMLDTHPYRWAAFVPTGDWR